MLRIAAQAHTLHACTPILQGVTRRKRARGAVSAAAAAVAAATAMETAARTTAAPAAQQPAGMQHYAALCSTMQVCSTMHYAAQQPAGLQHHSLTLVY